MKPKAVSPQPSRKLVARIKLFMSMIALFLPFILVWIAYLLTGFAFSPVDDVFRTYAFWMFTCCYSMLSWCIISAIWDDPKPIMRRS